MSSTEQSCINIVNRTEIEIKGVKDIISYDCEKIIFDMEDSELWLSGNNFNIKKIDVDNKCAVVVGYVSSLSFSDAKSKTAKSFLASLFK